MTHQRNVGAAMTEVPDTIGPAHSVRDAARLMARRGVGAAIVVDPELPGPGILTERDVLKLVAEGADPSAEKVEDRNTASPVTATADWSIDRAAEAMIAGGFRHLLVVEEGDLRGVVSMRDIVGSWVAGDGPDLDVDVRDVMSTELLTVTGEESLHDAAASMTERNVGAAIVPAESRQPGILTEHDLLEAVAAGNDTSTRTVAEHATSEAICATPAWSLRRAAETMVEQGFRHLVVLEDEEPAGMLSVRDIVRHATGAGG